MKPIRDLEAVLTEIAEEMNWRAVMSYEHGKLTGIAIGTESYIADTLDISWQQPELPAPRLRLIKDAHE